MSVSAVWMNEVVQNRPGFLEDLGDCLGVHGRRRAHRQFQEIVADLGCPLGRRADFLGVPASDPNLKMRAQRVHHAAPDIVGLAGPYSLGASRSP